LQAKRQCFSSSKEFEKLQESSVLANSNKNTSSVPNNNVHNNANANNNATNGSNSVLSEVRSRSRLLTIGVPPLDKDPLKVQLNYAQNTIRIKSSQCQSNSIMALKLSHNMTHTHNVLNHVITSHAYTLQNQPSTI